MRWFSGRVGSCFHFCFFSTVLTWPKVNLHCCYFTPGQLQALGVKWEAGTLPSSLAGEPHRPAPGPAMRKGGCKELFLLLNQGLATSKRGFPRGTSGNEPTQQCRRQKRWGLDPWVGKLPWRRVWQPSNILAWRIPRTDEPGGLQSTGTPRAGHASSDLAHRQAGGRTFFYFLLSV